MSRDVILKKGKMMQIIQGVHPWKDINELNENVTINKRVHVQFNVYSLSFSFGEIYDQCMINDVHKNCKKVLYSGPESDSKVGPRLFRCSYTLAFL